VRGRLTLFLAGDSDGAIALARQHADIDVICVDLRLPDGDGIAFIDALRALSVTTPVLVLSAESAPEQIERALAGGAIGYIS